jgi:hypothetical protein
VINASFFIFPFLILPTSGFPLSMLDTLALYWYKKAPAEIWKNWSNHYRQPIKL